MTAREAHRAPEKKARYEALPWWYRFLCPLVVAPLFTAIPLLLFMKGFVVLAGIIMLVGAPAAMLLMDVGAVRWYRKAGLWGAK